MAEAALATGVFQLAGFLDDAFPGVGRVWGWPVFGPTAELANGRQHAGAAIVGTEAQLGAGVIVNCGAVVDHDCRVDDFGHLGVNAAMAGGSVLGRSGWMQAGSVLVYGAVAEAGVVLGPGEAINQTKNRNGIQ